MLYKCEKCSKYFNHKTHYETHLKRKIPCDKHIHQNDKNKNETDITTYQISQKSVLDENTDKSKSVLNKYFVSNTKKCININTYKCVICDKIYKHSQSLYNHKKQKHPNYDDDVKKVLCEKLQNNTDVKLLQQKLEQTENKLNLTEQKLENLAKVAKKKVTKNITNNGTINNIINIIGFGHEDPKKLTVAEGYSILSNIPAIINADINQNIVLIYISH